jgi:hypothetical protein
LSWNISIKKSLQKNVYIGFLHETQCTKCDRAVEIDTIAKWLGVPPQYVEVPTGHGAFWDCVKYLTHEDEKQQKLGKYLYSDDEVVANFDFREALAKRDEKRLRYNGYDLSVKDQMRYDVHSK